MSEQIQNAQAPAAAPAAVAPAAPATDGAQAVGVEVKPADTKAADTKAAEPRKANPHARVAPKAASAQPAQVQAQAPVQPVTAQPAQPAQPTPDPRIAELTTQVDGLRQVIALTANEQLAALPENVRGYVKASAGDDPARQITAIKALRDAGLVQAPLAAPITTAAPAAPAAQPAAPTGDAAILARWQELKASGAHLTASTFYTANARAIEAALRANN